MMKRIRSFIRDLPNKLCISVVLQSPIQTPVLNGLGDMGWLDLLGAFQVGDGAADFKELKRLGDHIRKRKLELGLFQREVAQRIRVTQGTVYRWEGNETTPPIRSLPGIIAVLFHFHDQSIFSVTCIYWDPLRERPRVFLNPRLVSQVRKI